MAEPVVRRVVAIALVWRADEILVALRPPQVEEGGRWEFPGGKVEPGESPEQALVRECHEELGVAVEVGPLAWRSELITPGRRLELLFFHARLRAAEPAPRALAADAIAWRRPRDLAGLPFCPADRPLLAALQAGEVGPPR